MTPVPAFHPDRILEPPPSAEWERRFLAQPLPVLLEVESGDTLSTLLTGLGLAANEAHDAAAQLARHVEPRKIRAGSTYAAYFDDAAHLSGFEIGVEDRGKVHLSRESDGWTSTWQPYVRTVERRAIAGTLSSSLEDGLRTAGAPAVLAYEMADVLQWDLDFSRDLRVGDRFYALYEEVFLDGEYSSLGSVLALRYENRGEILEAYRFAEGTSYYDAQGRPLKKMFLRSPLKFSRITSRFSRRRFHPVLKRYRPHYGVDYGAPTGTPARVTASGTVTFVGWNKGGGRTVKVRHPGGYETNYLHLSGYPKGIRPGRSVRQGEVIGYVGSTGLATASHLDYRVKRNGRWINPLSIKSVPAKALSAGEREQFLRLRDQLRAQLAASSVPLNWPSPHRDDLVVESPSSEPLATSSVAAGSR